MEFDAIAGSLPEANQLRARVKEALASRYVGWSDDYDRQFDSHSTWFGLRHSREYAATCKLIMKRHAGGRMRLPMESGDLSAFSIPDQEGACEASGLSLLGSRHILALLCGMGHWMLEHDIGWVYSIVDQRNTNLQLMYRRLGFEFLPGQQVSFSGFCHKDDGAPVLWQVIRMSPTLFRSEEGYEDLGRLGCTGYHGCSNCHKNASRLERTVILRRPSRINRAAGSAISGNAA